MLDKKQMGNNIVIRDTPGSSDSIILEQVAEAALSDTDLCVCVYDAGAFISEAEREATDRLHKQLGGNLVFAVNRTNLLNSIERIREVEDLAKVFFGSMEYPQEGLGKYYIMCSAPGMIDLDGFDTWIESLSAARKLSFLNALRHQAASGQIKSVKEEIRTDAGKCSTQISRALSQLNLKHSRIKEEKASQIKRDGDKEAQKIRDDINAAEKDMTGISGLSGIFEKLTTNENWKDTYSRETKKACREYFAQAIAGISWKHASLKAINSTKLINNVFQTLSFPDSKSISVKATGGEVTGWAAAGTAIGALLGGPIGAAVGAAIGAGIGGSDSTKDNSVPNTMDYVKSTVIPALQQGFRSAALDAAKEKKKSADGEAKKVKSGLEPSIEALEKEKKLLEEFCAIR